MNIIIIFSLILLLLIFHYIDNNWISPGNLFIFYWAINIIIAFLVFNKKIYFWKYEGIIWIIFCLFIFSFSSTLGENILNKFKKYNYKINNNIVGITINEYILKIILLLCFILSLLYQILIISYNGFSISIIFNIKELFDINSYMKNSRYGDIETYYNRYMQILLIFQYLGPLISGFVYRGVKGKKLKFLCIIQFIPVIISLIFSNSKLGLVASLFFFIDGYIVFCVSNNVKFKLNFFKKNFFKISLIVVCFYLLFYLSFYFRYGGNEIYNIQNRMFMYSIGHVPSFDNLFYSSKFSIFGESFGYRTFSGVFRLFLGTLKQKTDTSILVTDFGWTNVPTAFISILNDFGTYGSIFFFGIMGFIVGFAYTKVRVSNHSLISIVILSTIYFFIFYSFLVSPWIYVSYIYVFVFFWIFLHINKHFEKNIEF